jgi:trans-2-enoyl-CoA reductase
MIGQNFGRQKQTIFYQNSPSFKSLPTTLFFSARSFSPTAQNAGMYSAMLLHDEYNV